MCQRKQELARRHILCPHTYLTLPQLPTPTPPPLFSFYVTH